VNDEGRQVLQTGTSSPGVVAARPVPLGWILAGLALLLCLAPLASELPDGLEFAAERLGVKEAPAVVSPLAVAPDYSIEKLGHGGASKTAAGLAGVVLMLLLGKGLVWLRNRPSGRSPS
jgi:hypothetical protein